jgi:ubiquinone/menaquinone biosynthesis C-methylase UbiE
MKRIDPKIYNKEYYLNICLGNDEFIKSGGKRLHPKVLSLISKIPVTKNMKILDIGCGRGDIALYLAKKAEKVIGIDYSQDAIEIANLTKSNFSSAIQKKTEFKVMNAKKLLFENNSFDLILCIDVFEHLYPAEVQIMLRQIKRVLKPNGFLFVHTGTNRILNDFTYKYYIRPMNIILTKIDQIIKQKTYPPLPSDPRTVYEKEQHVNEPTYYYLKDLFKKFNFDGKINVEVGCIKTGNKLRTKIYNFLVAFYPFSKLFPLSIIFGWSFICLMRNKK